MRFLWDAHNCEEAREEEELVVSTPYIEHWNELIDLWYLGMQVDGYNQIAMTIVEELLNTEIWKLVTETEVLSVLGDQS